MTLMLLWLPSHKNLGVALIVTPSGFTAVNRHRIASQAMRLRIPAMFPGVASVEAGGLASYGVDLPDMFRRAASYVDRILKGEKPGELPVQAPIKFQLIINLNTAKALGLDVPALLQQRANE